jgi:hypothetical protein
MVRIKALEQREILTKREVGRYLFVRNPITEQRIAAIPWVSHNRRGKNAIP